MIWHAEPVGQPGRTCYQRNADPDPRQNHVHAIVRHRAAKNPAGAGSSLLQPRRSPSPSDGSSIEKTSPRDRGAALCCSSGTWPSIRTTRQTFPWCPRQTHRSAGSFQPIPTRPGQFDTRPGCDLRDLASGKRLDSPSHAESNRSRQVHGLGRRESLAALDQSGHMAHPTEDGGRLRPCSATSPWLVRFEP